MNIVLTGFMATGKTSIGRAIADHSDYTFEDTDSMIITKTGMDINEIFSKYGEEHFRALERECVKEAALRDNLVIATGGGVVLDKRNIATLRKNGIIINLDPDFAVIESRVEKARASRPLMQGESIDKIRQRFEDRKPFYDNCDRKIHITEERTPDSYAEEILGIMEELV